MNKILNLLDKNYVLDLFRKKIMPLYQEYADIKKIEISPVKNDIWHTTYHVVIKFSVTLLTKNGDLTELPIYCTAHSSEPRKNAFEASLFLWQSNFSQGDMVVPQPLFFSDEFNGYFYRGIEGQTLYYYIKNKKYEVIEEVAGRAGAWLAKLHRVPTSGVKNFNPDNSRIETVIPGVEKILKKIKAAYPKYFEACKKTYDIIVEKEACYVKGGKQCLIHGDAHAKNVIKMKDGRTAIIDFTDICLADFTRDLGSFMQQLDFMALKRIDDPQYVEKIKKLFLDNYLLNSGLSLNDEMKDKISTYYNWTALRTATFFMLKDNPEPARSHGLLVKICNDLNIKINF